MTETSMQYYNFERTSACHGKDNPGGHGWYIEYVGGRGDSCVDIILPDNVAIEFARAILKHAQPLFACPSCGSKQVECSSCANQWTLPNMDKP